MAVSYNNTNMESSRWYNGEGICRNVWMLVNSRPDSVWVTLHSDVKDPDGKVLQTLTSTVPVASGEVYFFRQQAKVVSPRRWDIEHPELYEVVSRVEVEGELSDLYRTPFGIRTVEFTPEEGLLLNGRKVLAKGVNIHHDLGPLGAAAFERGFERRLEGLKRLGVNAIRLSHNPHDKFIDRKSVV